MMIFSLRKFLERLKFIILFLVFTYVFSHVFGYVSAWLEPSHRFKAPSGKAVKVFDQGDFYGNENTMGDRLRFFYWFGE
jgi:hypothetical protein